MNRNLIICLVSLLFVFSACRKNGKCSDDQSEGKLNGTWELRSVVGGFSGGKTYPDGNGNIIKFEGSTYTRYTNGQQYSQGSFTISKEIFPENNKVMDKLKSLDGAEVFVEITSNILTIYHGSIAADGTRSTYARK